VHLVGFIIRTEIFRFLFSMYLQSRNKIVVPDCRQTVQLPFPKTRRYCTSSMRYIRMHMTRLHGVIKQGTTIRAPQGSQWPAGEYSTDKIRGISTPFKVEGSAPLPPYPAVLVPYIDPNPLPPATHRTQFLFCIHHFIFTALYRNHWLYYYISDQLYNPGAVIKYLGHNAGPVTQESMFDPRQSNKLICLALLPRWLRDSRCLQT